MSSISSPARARFPVVWRDFFRFMAWPIPQRGRVRLDQQWCRDLLALAALQWTLLLAIIAAAIVWQQLFNGERPPIKRVQASPAALVAIMVLAAPFFEELIFRSWFPLIAWLERFWSPLRALFPAAVWASTCAFGLLHLTNYLGLPDSVFVIALVAPQLWSGSIFAFARVRLGFVGGLLLHVFANSVAFTAMLAFDEPTRESFRCDRLPSGLFRCESQSGRVWLAPAAQAAPKK